MQESEKPAHPDRRGAILITGASSGIGRALALDYAEPGAVLFLGGRHSARLEDAAAACRAKGADVVPHVVDVTDAAAMTHWIASAERQAELGLVIANAGIFWAGEGRGEVADDDLRRLFQVNVIGVLNTVLPALPAMRARRRGQIALMGSMAGFRGRAAMGGYCASKAAVMTWGEALRELLAADDIAVSVICPGHVQTPTCGVTGDRALSAAAAAVLIRQGLAADRPLVAFPLMKFGYAWLSSCIPPAAQERLRGWRRLLSPPRAAGPVSPPGSP